MPEFKSAPAHDLKLDEKGSISAAFAQLQVIDADGDVTLPGAFPTKDVPMSAYGHTSWDGSLPIGKGTIQEEGNWAVFRGQLFLETSQGRDAYETLKGLGPLSQFSYGFKVTDHSFGTQDGQPVRFLKGLDVMEVSPVLVGAGRDTHLLSIKSGAPASDAPMADLLAWYSEAEKAVLDRFTSHALARASEGRKLSRADRAHLEDNVESIGDVLEKLLDLIEADDFKEVDPVTLEVLLGTARAYGVAI
jgi:HK97 family phage prohead protease